MSLSLGQAERVEAVMGTRVVITTSALWRREVMRMGSGGVETCSVYLWGMVKVGEGPIMPSRRTMWIGVDILKNHNVEKVESRKKMKIYMGLICHSRRKLGMLTMSGICNSAFEVKLWLQLFMPRMSGERSLILGISVCA